MQLLFFDRRKNMKTIDITEKLSFEERPELVIKGTHIKVNNDALSMLKIMGNFADKEETEAVTDSVDLLFDETEKQKLQSLDLNFKDFMTVIETAMDLIRTGEDSGEQ